MSTTHVSASSELLDVAHVFAERIVDTVREPLIILRPDLRVQSASRSFYRVFGTSPEQTVGRLIYDLGNGQWNIAPLRVLLETILPQNERFDDYEVTHVFPGMGLRIMLLNARRLDRVGNQTEFIVLAIEDVTGRRALQAEREALIARLNTELARQARIAQALQRPLLMETAENAFPGLSVATIYSAAWTDEAEVGGDFYDTFALADGRIALLVGDVTGKGLIAAARAQECKDVLRAFLRLEPYSPAVALARLNDYYCEALSLDERMIDSLLALSLAAIDLKANVVSLAWAGSEPPLVLRADGKVNARDGGGALIGAMEHAEYPEITIPLLPDDTLFLSTDGLSEAHRGKEFLGQEGVIALLESATGQTVRQIGESVVSGARAFAGGQLHDDACVVLARPL